MDDNQEQDIVWEPTPKQAEFLSCDDYEVLYGGAAGGGKTDAILMDAWCGQYDGPQNPNHRGILFRRTFKELEDIIERSHSLYPNFIEGAKYNKVEHIWRTPWGAKLEFGHLNHDNDRFKYRGRAFNWMGFEELTLWPTDTCYRYLKSRLRTTDKLLPRYLRSNSNPDGPGQKWVMKNWAIEQSGAASRIVVPTEFEESDGKGGWQMVQRMIIRSFIPSKLTDNPYLRGTGYRETLMDMSPDERDALLLGLWNGNQVKGAFYFNEMQRARADGRIGAVPAVTGVPVNTFWDLGMNDTTAIWFHQGMGPTNRFVRCYENSGEGIEHYAQILQQFAKDFRYVYGTHYLPHDAAHTTLASAGKMVIQLFREALPGHKFVTVPRTPHLIVGINQTRKVFGNCYFDAEGCVDGIAALDAYRKKWNDQLGAFTNAHVHDWSSNYADAFRQFGQGFEPAQKHVKPPEWQKKLHSMSRAPRSPMTS